MPQREAALRGDVAVKLFSRARCQNPVDGSFNGCPWINDYLNSKPLQQTPVSENASETGYGGYGHIAVIFGAIYYVRLREKYRKAIGAC